MPPPTYTPELADLICERIADATPDWVDALATVAGGAVMAGWLEWM